MSDTKKIVSLIMTIVYVLAMGGCSGQDTGGSASAGRDYQVGTYMVQESRGKNNFSNEEVSTRVRWEVVTMNDREMMICKSEKTITKGSSGTNTSQGKVEWNYDRSSDKTTMVVYSQVKGNMNKLMEQPVATPRWCRGEKLDMTVVDAESMKMIECPAGSFNCYVQVTSPGNRVCLSADVPFDGIVLSETSNAAGTVKTKLIEYEW